MAGKTRVHELAKELGVAPKLIIDQLHGMGYKEQSSASAIDDALLPRLRELLGDQAAEYARKEAERIEAERAAAQRAKIEAAKASAAKAARTRAK
jgi:translation initiation factor IF-2